MATSGPCCGHGPTTQPPPASTRPWGGAAASSTGTADAKSATGEQGPEEGGGDRVRPHLERQVAQGHESRALDETFDVDPPGRDVRPRLRPGYYDGHERVGMRKGKVGGRRRRRLHMDPA